MKITDDRVGFLTNFEVLNAVKDDLKRDGKMSQFSAQNGFQQQVVKYLTETSPVTQKSAEELKGFLTTMAKHNLSQAEVLQIANLKPTKEVEINLIVEECAERFSRKDSLNLLQTINQQK
jgi:DNA-directed RNA polymerase subunit F